MVAQKELYQPDRKNPSCGTTARSLRRVAIRTEDPGLARFGYFVCTNAEEGGPAMGVSFLSWKERRVEVGSASLQARVFLLLIPVAAGLLEARVERP
jgi:hypothetical protein